jgi:adenylate cyclase
MAIVGPDDMAVRITVTYEGVERILEFDASRVAIGRPSETDKPDADLSPDSHVSRQHAVLEIKNSLFFLTDASSRSGTQVNGREIRGLGEWRLWPGDIVQIGQTTLRVAIAGAGKPVVAAPRSRPPPSATDPSAGNEQASNSPIATPAKPATTQPQPPSAPTPLPVAPTPIPDFPGALSATELKIVKMVDTGPRAPLAAVPGVTPEEKRLALLLDFPRQFSAQTGINGLYQTIMARIVEVIPAARRGALLMRDGESDKLLLKAYVSSEEPAVSETLARRTLSERRAFIWTAGAPTDMSQSIRYLQIVNGMYAPLQWQDQVFGVICVDSPRAEDRFSEDDLQFLVSIGRYAGMALAEQQLHAALRRSDKLIDRLLANFSPKLRAVMVEHARLGKLRPGGAKSEVTILYCDVCGFTQRAAEMDAHDVVDMLNDYFQPMIDAIFHEDGVVDKFVGDAVLAVFGSPETDPQQHQKAVRAAVALQQSVQATSRLRAARNDVICQVRVGVHCGEVFHGFMGTLNRLEYTVIGDAVNRACRYCQAAGEGEILISPNVFQHVFGLVKAEKSLIQTKEGELLAHRVRELKT